MDDTSDKGEGEYEVGYGKPPRASRFKKGQSGNPQGRPKRRDSAAIIRKVIDRPVTVRAGGRRRKASLVEIMTTQLRDKALKGDPVASREMRQLIEAHDDPPEAKPELTPEEQARQEKWVKVYIDHQEIRDALIALKLAELNEDGRTKLGPEFFRRLLGDDYQVSDDPVVQTLLRYYLVGTP